VVRTPRRITQNGERVTTKISPWADASLDAPVNEHDEGSASYIDFVPDSRYDPAHVTENSQLQQRLDQAMATLNYRERVVVSDHLLGDATLQDLSIVFDGISGERVRQIGVIAVNKLATYMTTAQASSAADGPDANKKSGIAEMVAALFEPKPGLLQRAPTVVPESAPHARRPDARAKRIAAAMG